METLNSYWLIIAGAIIIILSYIFNLISGRTSIPSVLLLIGTGILISSGIRITGNSLPEFGLLLEILGVIGLILIVLEASLDLKLSREKRGMILSSLGMASFSLVITAGVLSLILVLIMDTSYNTALLYSIPLSIISSAIVIPSTSNLENDKKEFMIYESTISDILGIMFFYFIIASRESEGAGSFTIHIFLNLLATISLSFIISYILIFVFQKIKTELKLFLLIAVLILLYSVAKLLHFSSLLLILVFGMVLQNRHLFFPGKLKKLVNENNLQSIAANFKIITLESAFVVRTFFFVIFGLSISLSSLVSVKVFLISAICLGVIYGSRYLVFRMMKIKNLLPELFLAPRGLITILLFYAIPDEMLVDNFDPGILLFIIIASSLAMTISLVKYKKRLRLEVAFPEAQVPEKIEKAGTEATTKAEPDNPD